MTYQRFSPPERLRNVVDHVWLVESAPLPQLRQEILIPNGRPGLAVALGEPGTRHDPVTQVEWPNAASVFGVMTRPHVLGQVGTSSYAGVEFTPWGLGAFGLSALVDEVQQLGDWVGADAVAGLTTELQAEPFGPGRAERLAGFLAARLTTAAVQPVVVEAVHAIDELRGQVAVAEVVRRCGTSYSTLYRLFRRSVGIGPKQHAEIIRYYHFVGGLLGGPADAAATLSALHGYYDQAHAARDFRRYTGVSATQFLAVQNGIAALMHGRSVQDEPSDDA
ncbi:AraC family transcriptional regulator [Kribbella sp. VKM Ac-2569]|uniref:helix-turn-helix domain-containing protein n=1 Tax=Kribbella sp. VKM Ac-2569 TaxID=2512220 RepID=UPI00102B53D2|nr:AraC family transcriptional regulator [Kribbella sp. VKM Ac-2569]RZT19918.1 AraC family transcriptional regulator [Kribbella sp. VKM Ac-2569]